MAKSAERQEFEKVFKTQREYQGKGGRFWYKGTEYSTDYPDEAPKKSTGAQKTEPNAVKTPTKGTVDQIPKDSSGPVRGERIDNDSELMRNVKNTAAALTPFGVGLAARAATGAAKLGQAARAGFNAGRAEAAAARSAPRQEPHLSPKEPFSKSEMEEGASNWNARNRVMDRVDRIDAGGYKKGGKVKAFAKGGYVRAADGVAQRGKTRGKYV